MHLSISVQSALGTGMPDMAMSPTEWLGDTEAHLVDLMLSKLRTHLDGVWVDDATGTVHQMKATGDKEMEMHTVDADGRSKSARCSWMLLSKGAPGLTGMRISPLFREGAVHNREHGLVGC